MQHTVSFVINVPAVVLSAVGGPYRPIYYPYRYVYCMLNQLISNCYRPQRQGCLSTYASKLQYDYVYTLTIFSGFTSPTNRLLHVPWQPTYTSTVRMSVVPSRTLFVFSLSWSCSFLWLWSLLFDLSLCWLNSVCCGLSDNLYSCIAALRLYYYDYCYTGLRPVLCTELADGTLSLVGIRGGVRNCNITVSVPWQSKS